MNAPSLAGDHDGAVVAVLIVGGGPTGVVAATMLAQRGIETVVIDRYAEVYPLPRAVHLDDEVYRILQSIGAAEAFTAISQPRQGLRVVDARLRTMAQFDRTRPVGEYGWPQANFFDQPELERVLRDNLARCPRARLLGRTELVGLDQNGHGPAPVRAVLRDLDTGTQHTLWAHAVLGCDGANSTVRELIGSSLLDLGFEERWLVVDVASPQPLDVWDGVYQVSDTRRPATFMQVAPGRYRWEFRLGDGESLEELITPHRLAELIRPWTKDVPFETLQVQRKAEYTFRARIADRWQDRRVFLLGDAAHLTPPFIGQGLCAAMRDAANLTWKLAAVLAGSAPESLLATYAGERPEPAKALIKKAVLIGTVMTGGPSATASLRRAGLAALCRLPGVSEKVLDTPAPPLPAGPLVLKANGAALPGTLAPQPWVVAEGKRRRLDDVLGTGFAVLTTAPPPPQLRDLAGRLAAPVVLLAPVPLPGGAVEGVDAVAVDADGILLPWLAAAATTAVLVRPDRVVLAQAPPGRRGVDDTVHEAVRLAAPPAPRPGTPQRSAGGRS